MASGYTTKTGAPFQTVTRNKYKQLAGESASDHAEDSETICKHCAKVVEEELGRLLDTVSCSRCKVVFHKDCSNLNTNECNFLNENPDSRLKYLCEECGDNPTGSSGHLNARMDNIEGNVDKVLKLLNKKDETTMDKVEWPTIQRGFQAQVKEVLREHKEKDDKEKNIIIFNIPETDAKKEIKDQIEEDEKTTMDIIHFLDENINQKEVKIQRLGRRNQEDKGRLRPIKVILPSPTIQQDILSNARKLRNYTKLERVGLSHDKTTREQERDRTLSSNLNKMRLANPDKDLIIFEQDIYPRKEVQEIREKRRRDREALEQAEIAKKAQA